MKANNFALTVVAVLGLSLALMQPALAQRTKDDKAPPPAIDMATGKTLTQAIEFLNAENYNGAKTAIAKLDLAKLSPYERSHVEQILASIDHAQENYPSARNHLQEAIAAGGLNEVEVQGSRYQIAQLYLTEEKWKEGAAALEEWFKTAQTPNSAAYYLLAVAYYQQNDYKRALAPAQKAVDMTEKPQESWIQLVLALHLQEENYKEAIPLLERLISQVPDKKTYWMQLSSVYGQMEDYPKALAIMQLAHHAGLVTEDSEVRRLSDLLVFNEVPYRGAKLLTEAIENKIVTPDAKLFEKLANSWIAAREYEKAIAPLQRAADMSANGELFVRLGEVQVQREQWAAAAAALERGINKGGLRDTANAQLLMGVSLFNQKNCGAARSWFQRAESSDRHRTMARGYLRMISADSSTCQA